MTDILSEKAARLSPAYWAGMKRIQLANGRTFTFERRGYQIEPMQSERRRLCVMKATGLGFSEIFILRSLHGCIYQRYPQGVLYLFPNADEMRKFSKARFGPLIQANREAIGKYIKSGGRSTDAADIKRIGTSTLYMDGATLTQTVGDSVQQKESAALRGKQVDCVIYDELDLMDWEEVIPKAEGRMRNSELQESVYISNPTIPSYGIDKIFHNSSQKLWNRRCGCGGWTCPDEEFPDLIGIDDRGKGYIACKKCGKPLDYVRGEWVARCPDNKEVDGYRISHLNSSMNDPYELLKEFKVAQDSGKISDFYKLRLGLPYMDTEDQLRIGDCLACCGQDIMQAQSMGPCAMGVDVGKLFHVIIGTRTDRDRFEILKIARLGSFDDVALLARQFNVKSAVIDIRPYEDSARQFQRNAKYRVFLCEYTENPMQDAFWDNKRETVKAYRTGAFDSTHRLITDKKIVIPRRCPEIDEFAKQLCATAKVLETNKRNNTSVYRYRKLGDDHYRNALNYFYLAVKNIHPASSKSSFKRQTKTISEYDCVKC